MAKITVDGKVIECKDRQMILQACLDAGISVPYYCYHPGLSIVASCRICLVEVEGIPKLVPACQTPVREGMVVHAASSKAIANQKQVMEYLLVNHPLDCPVCDQAGECGLQDYSYEYGRSQSRFEEEKAKKPKKDVGEHVLLYGDRCIMCTRCVRFTREITGTNELYVDGRGVREQINIFPGKPLNNPLAGNVVDICPVGALLDKEFLFKQRVWLLSGAPSISPIDAGGENIWLDHNQGKIYRIRPRVNPQVNGWWISDATRYSWKAAAGADRLVGLRKMQYGTAVDLPLVSALEQVAADLKNLVAANGAGSLYAMLSPMMSCEEAWLLGKLIRKYDAQAMLVMGPIPAEETRTFSNPQTGKQTFVIQGEKVPNAAGVRRVMQMLGGASATWEEFAAQESAELKKLKGGWIVGGYLSAWLPKDLPMLLKRGYRVVQDILPNALTAAADVLLPGAAWCEKDGCWENYAGVMQPFAAAVAPPEGTISEAEVYLRLLDQAAGDWRYDAAAVRRQMGEPFAAAALPLADEPEPIFEFSDI